MDEAMIEQLAMDIVARRQRTLVATSTTLWPKVLADVRALAFSDELELSLLLSAYRILFGIELEAKIIGDTT